MQRRFGPTHCGATAQWCFCPAGNCGGATDWHAVKRLDVEKECVCRPHDRQGDRTIDCLAGFKMLNKSLPGRGLPSLMCVSHRSDGGKVGWRIGVKPLVVTIRTKRKRRGFLRAFCLSGRWLGLVVHSAHATTRHG